MHIINFINHIYIYKYTFLIMSQKQTRKSTINCLRNFQFVGYQRIKTPSSVIFCSSLICLSLDVSSLQKSLLFSSFCFLSVCAITSACMLALCLCFCLERENLWVKIYFLGRKLFFHSRPLHSSFDHHFSFFPLYLFLFMCFFFFPSVDRFLLAPSCMPPSTSRALPGLFC